MRITAITRFKHAGLHEAHNKSGLTVKEICSRVGISLRTWYKWTSLKGKPDADQCRRIQNTFGAVGIFLDVENMWPENFVGFGASLVLEQTKDIDDIQSIQSCHEALQIPQETTDSELYEDLHKQVDRLPAPLARVVKLVIFEGKSQAECDDIMEVGHGVTHMRLAQALRRLRHPRVIKNILGEDIVEVLNPKSLAMQITRGDETP